MLRRLMPLAVFLPLAGCGFPPALIIASYAADGVLLVTSGKSSTDHLLSMAEKRDCAVWRVVKNRPVCQDFADSDPYESWRDPGEVEVAVQSTDAGFPTDLAEDMRRREQAMREAQNAKQDKAERIQLAQAGAGQPVTSARDVTGPSNRTMSDVSSAPLPAVSVPAAAVMPPTLVPTAPVAQPVAPIPAPVAAAPEPASKPVAEKTAKSGKGGTYVVLGSYKMEENAKRIARQHQALKPQMQSVTVRGERYTRVVVGPYSAAEAAAVKERVKTQGAADAFTAAACMDKTAARCIGGSEG
jgi:hypothetical protein